jgi:hypothetical protein
MWTIKNRALFQSHCCLATELRAGEVGEQQHRASRLGCHVFWNIARDSFKVYRVAVRYIYEQHLLSLVLDEADAIFHNMRTDESLRRE